MGKVFLKVVARRLGAYCEVKGLLPEQQCGFRPNRSTTDVMFVVHRLQEIGWKAGVFIFMRFIDLQKAYKTIAHTLLWQVLTRIGVSPRMIAAIRQFHDGMRACVRPDDGVCSEWFEVEQGLRQGYVLSPLLTCLTIGGRGRGYNNFVSVLGGDDTKIAPTGDVFDQPPGGMS